MQKSNKTLTIIKYIILCLLTGGFVYVQVMVDLSLPDYMRRIIDKGIIMKNMDTIWDIGFDMILVALLGGLATILASLTASIVAAGASKYLRANIFKKVESFSLNEFDKFSTASLITRNTNDVQQIQLFIFLFLRLVISSPIMAIGGIIKALETSKEISWILAIAIPVTLAFIFILMFLLVPIYNKVQGYIDRVNKVSREQLNGIRVIRAFRNEKFEEGKFDDANSILTKTNIKLNRIMTMIFPVVMLILNFVQLAIVWFGAKAVGANKMNLGEIMAFIGYAMQVIFSFIMLSMVSIILPRAVVSWKRIYEVIKAKPTIVNKENAINTTDSENKESVEFKNVSFSYPDANEKVLDDISFKAKKGDIIAFIGSTGSGKTTLVNLVSRFYDVTDGQVLVNGVDVRDYEMAFLHNMIGYVPQKAFLFSGNIYSNIMIGKNDTTEEEIQLAAKIAQAEEFINEKEEGYKSEISQGGTNVSGGQKQRLSIARALVRKPAIYIFDDSFSALDFKTDNVLRKALTPYTKEAVTLIVAQRISTIMNADQIVVLDDGKAVGIGTHRELLESCSVYQEIASSQLSKEELE